MKDNFIKIIIIFLHVHLITNNFVAAKKNKI